MKPALEEERATWGSPGARRPVNRARWFCALGLTESRSAPGVRKISLGFSGAWRPPARSVWHFPRPAKAVWHVGGLDLSRVTHLEVEFREGKSNANKRLCSVLEPGAVLAALVLHLLSL